MESWVASAIGMSVSALAVGLVYLFLHRQYHHTFLRTWAIGWALYGLAVVFEVRLTHRYDSSYLLLANQAALLGSAVMLLLGVEAFLGKRAPSLGRPGIFVAVLMILWIVAASLFNLPPAIQQLPNAILLGVGYSYLGWLMLKRFPLRTVGRLMSGFGFLAWGLLGILAPIWFWRESLQLLGEAITWALHIIVALGLLLAYFEMLKQDLEESEQRYRTLVQALNETEENYRRVVQQQGDGVALVDENEVFTFVNPAAEDIFGVPPGGLVNHTLREFLTPEQFEAVRAQTSQRRKGATSAYDLEITRPDGKVVSMLVKATPRFDPEGHFLGTLGVFHDITERKRAEAEIERLLVAERTYRRQAETLRDATTVMVAALDVEQLLDHILVQLENVVAYDSACIFLFEGDQLRAVAAHGFEHPEAVINQYYPANSLLTGAAANLGRPLLIADVREDDRFEKWGDSEHVRGWMCIPLVWRQKVVGFLTVDSRTPNAYNEEQATLAQAFANQAALAIQNSRLFQETRRLAVTDPLTGLYNRRQLFDLARAEFDHYQRFQGRFSVVMMDMDHFSQVNNTYGHQVGDVVLRTASQRIRGVLRESDIVGRYGGEEFLAVLPDVDAAHACQVAERIRRAIAETPVSVDLLSVRVTISLGVAVLDEETLTLDELIERADQALYKSKQTGRNRVSVWQPGDQPPVE
ncbi:MAG TPA: diguanylate cyclase [Anaerolineaceae bacterium]|nr:diguanylate cyclase [Anaerolineaceae bacterium]